VRFLFVNLSVQDIHDRLQGTLGKENVLGLQNIISIQVASLGYLGTLDVPCGQHDVLVGLGKHEEVAVPLTLKESST